MGVMYLSKMKGMGFVFVMLFSSMAHARQLQLLRTPAPFIDGTYSNRLLFFSPAISNPSALAEHKGFAATVEMEQAFLLNETRLFSAMAVKSFEKNIVAGIIVSHNRFAGYSQTAVSLLSGRNLGNIQLAGEFSFQHSMTPGYGSASSMNAGISCRMQLSPAFTTGFRLRNLAGLIFKNEKLFAATVMAGAGYDASEVVHIACVWMQEGRGSPVVTTGLLYRFHPAFLLSFGSSFFPCQPYGGFQFQRKDWKVQLKTSFHPMLGWSPSLGIAYGNLDPVKQE